MTLFCHFNCNSKLTTYTLSRLRSIIGEGLSAAEIKEKLFMPKDNSNKYAGSVIINKSLIKSRLPFPSTIQKTSNIQSNTLNKPTSNTGSNRIINKNPTIQSNIIGIQTSDIQEINQTIKQLYKQTEKYIESI